jgi:hypothetical protein
MSQNPFQDFPPPQNPYQAPMQADPYGLAPDSAYRIQREIASQATTCLVVGILSLVCAGIIGIFLAPFAIYRGNKALRLIRQHNIGHEHSGSATAGKIIGIVSLSLHLVGLLGYVLLILGMTILEL